MTEHQALYYKLKLIREAEKAIIREYPGNEIKTPCHLAIGAEAIPVAVTHVFPNSAIFGTYRNHHWYLASGGNLKNFFLELYGRENPIADGKAGSMHLNSPGTGLIMTSAVVATQFGPSIGYAFAQKYKGSNQNVICVSGDGAIEEGAFYEALNLAALYDLQILFVIEDNGLAIHQHKESRQAFKLEKLAAAYGIRCYSRKAYRLGEAFRCARLVKKLPAIIRFQYHRFYEHVGIQTDYNAGYRKKPVLLTRVDPLFFEEKKIPRYVRAEIDKKVQDEVEAAVENAKRGKIPPKEKLLEHVYA